MACKRFLLAGCAALALAGSVGESALASAPGANQAQPPRASLTGYQCQPALDPPLRGIEVTAVMRPVPSTIRLELKPELLRARHANGPFRVVAAKRGALGKWASPTNASTLGQNPSDVWRVQIPVANLPAPAWYRLRVVFRWLGTGNTELAQTARLSLACYQPEQRPDLVVRSVAIVPVATATPAEDAYDAVVANSGLTGAGAFDVSLAEGQNVVGTVTVSGLGPHHSHAVHFVAPACITGEVITVTADPAHLIDVWDRTQSARSVVCP